MSLWPHIEQAIRSIAGSAFHIRHRAPVSGGCIHNAWQIDCDGTRFFVKTNRADALPAFAAEAAGLRTLAASHSVRVPQPVCHGTADGQAYLVLEWLDLQNRGNAAQLGQQLAALHRPVAPQFGFEHDNHIGNTPQHNAWRDDWVAFWRDQRLGFQLQLAAKNGLPRSLQTQGTRLMAQLGNLFAGHQPYPSLLHGDLWHGNVGYTPGEVPVMFDPAPYYGDREADLAMTELFGGFPAEFYAAYRAAWPLDPGYAVRKTLYKLYHVLNHANLFGGGYVQQAATMMQTLLTDSS